MLGGEGGRGPTKGSSRREGGGGLEGPEEAGPSPEQVLPDTILSGEEEGIWTMQTCKDLAGRRAGRRYSGRGVGVRGGGGGVGVRG